MYILVGIYILSYQTAQSQNLLNALSVVTNDPIPLNSDDINNPKNRTELISNPETDIVTAEEPLVQTVDNTVPYWSTNDMKIDSTSLEKVHLIKSQSWNFNTAPLPLQTPAVVTNTQYDDYVSVLPDDIFSQPIFQDKANWKKYLRYDSITVRLSWTLIRSVSGLFYWWYEVSPGWATGQQGMACVTAYPGVTFNVASQESVEMKIPWTHFTNAVSITSNDNLGPMATKIRLRLMPITAPFRPGTETLTFATHAVLDNPDLSMPSLYPITGTPSTTLALPAWGVDGDIPEDIEEIPELENQSGAAELTVMNKSKSFNPIDIVSSIGNMVGIPQIGEVAQGIGAAANLIGMFTGFGFSKPNNTTITTNIKNNPIYSPGLPHGDDNSKVMAVDPTATTDPASTTVFTSMDETAVSYIGERLAWIDRASFSTSTLQGSVIYSRPVRIGRAGSPLGNWTPGEFVAHHFKWVRCKAIKFTIAFAKTDLHNFELLAGFVANDTTLTTPQIRPDTVQAKVFTKISSQANVWKAEISVPYASNHTWVSPDDVIGTFFLKLVNPLAAPITVDPEIEFVIGKQIIGLVCSKPQMVPMYPVSGVYQTETSTVTVLSGPALAEEEETPELENQINLGQDNEENSVEFGEPKDPTLEMVATTTGDASFSLRPLFRMFSAHTTVSPVLLSSTYFARGPITNAANGQNNMFGALGIFKSMYFFHRGGVRWKFTGQGNYLSAMVGSTDHSSLWTAVDTNLSRVLEIEIPQYKRSMFGANCDNRAFYSADEDTRITVYTDTDTSKIKSYYAGADDFTYFGLHGVPRFDQPGASARLDGLRRLACPFDFDI